VFSGKSSWTRTGYVDGAASDATFNYPKGLALGPDGTLYVADNNAVRKIAHDGSVVTLAGGRRARVAASANHAFKYTGGDVDGSAQVAEFAAPVALAVDGSGYVYVADENNMAIRRVAPDGNVVTLVDLTNHYPPPTDPPTARAGAPIGIALLPGGALAICVPEGVFKYTIAEHQSR
jgi:sugar lactone lactonase YvrE